MSDTCPAPMEDAAFSAFILIGDAALLGSQFCIDQAALSVSTARRLV
jgi:hypothetical protein